MKHVFAALALLVSFQVSSIALADGKFPEGPNPSLTPGSLCNSPDQIRYPEKIAYCRRDVDSGLKRQIIRNYDQKLGYSIQSMDRQKFKIDHYIPLCAGGSNNIDNLWPQHESIFAITDSLEQVVCEKMAQGRLRQRDAIDYVKAAKNDLDKAPDIIKEVQSL